jgi:N-acetylneuraminic acid mutarotase
MRQSESDDLGREAAAHLAAELERSRRRSWRLMRLAVLAVAVTVVLAVAASYIYVDRSPSGPAVVPPTAEAPVLTWFPGLNLPTARSGLALVSDPSDGAIFAIAGRGKDGLLSDTLRLKDPIPRWEARRPKPTAVEYASVVALRGEFLVPGGCGAGGAATDVVEVYDPRADTWREAALLPQALCGYALAELEGKAYLFGGRGSDDVADASDTVLRYDPDLDTWSVIDRMPLPQSDLALAVVGGAIHLLGGRDRSGKLQTTHWVYRPWAAANARWDLGSAPPLPDGRAGLSAVASAVKNVYVVGGGWDEKLDDGVLLLRLASSDPSWEAQPDVPGFTPQRGAGMTLVEGRQLVLAGGEADGMMLDRQLRWEVVPSVYIFPGASGLR